MVRRIIHIRPIPALLARNNPISRALFWIVCLFSENMRVRKRWKERHERFLALPIEIRSMRPRSGGITHIDYTYINTKEET